MITTICKDTLEWGDEIGEMRSSNELLGDPDALRERMEADNYLLLRGFHPKDDVLAARKAIFAAMDAGGLKSLSPHDREIACLPEVLRLLESPRLFSFFREFFGDAALTFAEKWLRTVGQGGYTGLHFDKVYMGRGSKRLHTVWTPLGDLTKEIGTLAVWKGDAKELAELKQTYGAVDVDRDKVKEGWLSHSPQGFLDAFGGCWETTDVQAGDVIIINMYSMHCSTTNMTDELRLSCDTRFQPAGEPADERWHGESRSGHYAAGEYSIDEVLQGMKNERSAKITTYLESL